MVYGLSKLLLVDSTVFIRHCDVREGYSYFVQVTSLCDLGQLAEVFGQRLQATGSHTICISKVQEEHIHSVVLQVKRNVPTDFPCEI